MTYYSGRLLLSLLLLSYGIHCREGEKAATPVRRPVRQNFWGAPFYIFYLFISSAVSHSRRWMAVLFHLTANNAQRTITPVAAIIETAIASLTHCCLIYLTTTSPINWQMFHLLSNVVYFYTFSKVYLNKLLRSGIMQKHILRIKRPT